MRKTPNPRTAETTHVLRHVDMHHAPHTLKVRGDKLSRKGEKDPAGHSTILPTDGSEVQPTQTEQHPQWQAGQRQGYAEGVKAGLEQAKQALRDSQEREGFEKGYADGLAKARQQFETEALAQKQKLQNAFDSAMADANQECAKTIRRFDQLIRLVPERLSARMADMEDDMVELCFAMLCRILGDQLVTPAGVRALVSRATQDWPADADLTIHLHPEDLQSLRSVASDDFVDPSRANMLDHLSAELERRVRPPLQWVADASLGVGGCVLRSSKGGLDARLMVQMNALQDTLMGVRALRRDGRHSMYHATELKISGLLDPADGAIPGKNEGAQP